MDVIGRPSIACSSSIIHVFLLLSVYCGTPLIDNLVSCPLILKDVRLYDKVKRRMFFISFCQCQNMSGNVFICNSLYQAERVDDMTVEEFELHLSARASPCHSTNPSASSLSLYPPFRVLLLSGKPTTSELPSHTCSSCRLFHVNSNQLFFYFSLQVTRSLTACSRAAQAEALAPPCVPAATTLWTVEGKVSPPSQPTCLTAWPRCKHGTCLIRSDERCFQGQFNQSGETQPNHK